MLPQALSTGETLSTLGAHIFLLLGMFAQPMAIQFTLQQKTGGANLARERLLSMYPFVALHFLSGLEHFIAFGTRDLVQNLFLFDARRFNGSADRGIANGSCWHRFLFSFSFFQWLCGGIRVFIAC